KTDHQTILVIATRREFKLKMELTKLKTKKEYIIGQKNEPGVHM
ncbi:28002_t:CDS:1, partial [Gigaspora margarita]